jgi:hypothetical protein
VRGFLDALAPARAAADVEEELVREECNKEGQGVYLNPVGAFLHTSVPSMCGILAATYCRFLSFEPLAERIS